MVRNQDLKNMPIAKGTTFEDLSASDQLMVEFMSSGIGYAATGKKLDLTPLQVAKRYERIRKRVLLPTARLLASKLAKSLINLFDEGITAVKKDGQADIRSRLQTFKTFDDRRYGS